MKRRNEVLVGLLTLIAILIGVLGSVWIARGGLSSGYRVYAKFPWSAGLKLGQPVLLGGVTMGFVEDVDLREDGTIYLLALNERDEQVLYSATPLR